MKISQYFDRSEFACSCGCGFDTVDAALLEILEKIRNHYGVPVTVNSAARCLVHNRAIGSTDRSQHIQGKAADIVVDHVPPLSVYTYLESQYPNSHGIGSYETFTHIDSRDRRARWKG